MKLQQWVAAISLVGLGLGGCTCGTSSETPGVAPGHDGGPQQTNGADGSTAGQGDGGASDGAVLDAAAADDAGTMDAAAIDGAVHDDAGTPDGSAIADAGADDGGSTHGDAGVLDAATAVDAGGALDAAQPPDAGPNTDPVILGVTASSDPFVGSTTLTATVQDADGDTVECQFQATTMVSVTVDPASFSSTCTAVVTEAGLPRQQLQFTVLVRDGRGGTAQTTVSVDVDNHAPTAMPGAPVTAFPGDTAMLAAQVSDIDVGPPGNDLLTYAWSESTMGGPTAGVTLSNASAATPTVTVDRASYAGGPRAQTLTFALTVTDDRGETASTTVSVTIGDERGPYVDNRSMYAGTGPSGYCGSQARPCNNIADALVNLAALRSEGGSTETAVMVATTGTDYTIQNPIILDGALGVTCGYDPAAWTRTAARTPIRFTGGTGIHVRAPVAVTGCDVEGVAGSNGLSLERVAVNVEAAGATLAENRIVGNSAGGGAGNAVGVKATLPSDTASFTLRQNEIGGGVGSASAVAVQLEGGTPTVQDNVLTGGEAPTTVGLSFVGSVRPEGSRAVIRRNTIRGGSGLGGAGAIAVGVLIGSGNPSLEENPRIDGGEATGAVGVLVGQGATDPSISGSTIAGGTAVVAMGFGVGLALQSAATVTGNTISGGIASYAVGLAADGDPDDAAAAPFAFTASANTISGGTATALAGVNIEDGVTATLLDNAITGAAQTAITAATSALGINVVRGSSVTVTRGTVRAGASTNGSVGIASSDAATSVTVLGAEVTAGAATGPMAASLGINIGAGTLSLASQDGTPARISAGQAAGLSVGVLLSCTGTAAHSIEDAVISGGSGASSAGLGSGNCGPINSSGTTYTGGQATLSSAGADVQTATLTSNGDTFLGGPAGVDSMGVRVRSAVLQATSATATGGAVTATDAAGVHTSAGVWLVDATPGNAGSTLNGGDLTGGIVQSGLTSRSAGVIVDSAANTQSRNLVINAVTATGGESSGTSAGVFFRTSCRECQVVLSTLEGGAGEVSSGLLVDTADAAELRAVTVERNTITSSDLQGGTGESVASNLLTRCRACEIRRNFITAGKANSMTGTSIGMRVVTSTALSDNTFVYNNVIRAGDGAESFGVEASGPAGDTVRFLHNNIHAGADARQSAAVYAGGQLFGNSGVNAVGVFVGNILERGGGFASRHHFYEACRGGVRARPQRAMNNNFIPEVDDQGMPLATTLVSHVSTANCATGRTDLVTLDQVHTTAPYDGVYLVGVLIGGRSMLETPRFAADGYHLMNGSPLVNAADQTVNSWGFARGFMPDIDGQNRTNIPDIGVDEL